jgi:hypothetical protein
LSTALTFARGNALLFGLERHVVLNLHPLSTDAAIGVAIADGVIIKMGMLANLPTVGTSEGATVIVEPDCLRVSVAHDEELRKLMRLVRSKVTTGGDFVIFRWLS